MNHYTATLLILISAVATPLRAQQNIVYHPNNLPTGTKNAFPFGPVSKGVRTQVLVPGSLFGTAPILIQDIYVTHLGPSSTSSTQTEGEIVYGNLEIRLGVTTLATLTSTWATNLPNPTVVQTGRLRMRWKVGAWTPLGLQKPFLWAPASASDNLVVDLIQANVQDTGGLIVDAAGYILNTASGPSVQRVYLLNWPATQAPTGSNDTAGTKYGFLLGNGAFVGRGSGCQSSASTKPFTSLPSGTWPQLGALSWLEINQAGALRPAAAFLGGSETAWNSVPLPLDLTPVGAAGCMVWIDPLVQLGSSVTNASGYASVPLVVPGAAALLGVRVFATWASLDPANPFGLVTSDYGMLILGQ